MGRPKGVDSAEQAELKLRGTPCSQAGKKVKREGLLGFCQRGEFVMPLVVPCSVVRVRAGKHPVLQGLERRWSQRPSRSLCPSRGFLLREEQQQQRLPEMLLTKEASPWSTNTDEPLKQFYYYRSSLTAGMNSYSPSSTSAATDPE